MRGSESAWGMQWEGMEESGGGGERVFNGPALPRQAWGGQVWD